MSNLLVVYLMVVLVVVLSVIYLSYKKFSQQDKLGINGKLFWMDKGSKPFYNNFYGVYGKPDYMYYIQGGVLLVELKGRRGGVYENDIVQTKCAALAARGAGYRVIRILIRTKTTHKYFTVPYQDSELFAEVEHHIELARQAKLGNKMMPCENRRKCRGCSYKNQCEYVSFR